MTDDIKKEETKTEEIKKVETSKITYGDFKKVEIKVGKILAVARIEKSEKLLKLTVDFGLKLSADSSPEPEALGKKDVRQIISGIAKYFPKIEDLVGKRCLFVTNLEPKILMGLESNGMILAVGGGDDPFSLFEVQIDALVGKSVK